MRQISFSADADDDLTAIEEHSTDRWGSERSARYVDAIFACIDRLAEDPRLGHRSRGLPSIYRARNTGSHVVVYRDDPGANEIEVARILHKAMDIARHVTGKPQR